MRSIKRVLSILLILLTMAFAVEPVVSAQTVRRHRVRHGRTFWQKHRDKLTVVGTAATGAGIGALTGGKKGAAIGTAVGAGSGALYTYKLRKRHRRRY
jgi:outer membrane lipoprotein SlyB